MIQLSPFLNRRLVILTGKGGVGRTTVAAALARAASRAGKRVLLAQMESAGRLSRLLGCPPIGAEVSEVAPRLHAVNMTPRSALHQYGMMVLKYETVYRALFENKAVGGFLSAVPGLDAYAMLGKVWWHTTEPGNGLGGRKYDLVILDGPASGHAVTVLKIPQAVLAAMPKGPLARDAGLMRALFTNPDETAVVMVTLPEELPARETVELARQIRTELGMPLGPVVINAVPSPDLTSLELTALLAAVPRPPRDPKLAAALLGATLLAQRRRDAEGILAGLANTLPGERVLLPRLPTTDLGLTEVDDLSLRFYPSSTST